MTRGPLFVTGMPRSGTTLLQTLLDAQPQMSVLSQPFPLLFVEAKRAFLRSRGIDERYPLGHLFEERRYEPEDLVTFLDAWRPSHAELTAVFEQMREYSGQYTRFSAAEVESAIARIDASDDFASIIAKLLAQRSGDAEIVGLKEVACEELLPYLLERGFRCALIVRDPRAVVASLNHGRGRDFAGELKPTLFNVRSWRKSASFATSLDGRPLFGWCRYRDVAQNPVATLCRLADALHLGAIGETRVHELRNDDGEEWRGNSSFTDHRGVSAASVAVYRQILPQAVSEFIEATCLPELRSLGFPTTMTYDSAVRVIERFEEPYVVRHDGMERDLMSRENAMIEIGRLRAARAA